MRTQRAVTGRQAPDLGGDGMGANTHSTVGITRRALLRAGAAGAAGLLWPLGAASRVAAATQVSGLLKAGTLARFKDALAAAVPIWSRAELEANGLVMAPSSHQFHSQLTPSATWGYGGASYLGPTVEVWRTTGAQDSSATFYATNTLGPHLLGVDRELHGPDHHDDAADARASLHLHGGYTEELSDGYPEYTFTKGGTGPTFGTPPNFEAGPPGRWRYHYGNDQQAGSTWYHDHALGITRLNVYLGLAGYYYMRDAVDSGQPGGLLGMAGVPVNRGGREIPLVLQDKSFTERKRTRDSNELAYPDPWAPEFFGDAPVVNGKAWPYLDVDRAVYRFRILNGSSSRIYNLRCDDRNVRIYQIGTDLGLLAAAVLTSPGVPLVVAPGERADVIVDFRTARTAKVHLVDVALPGHVVSPASGPLGALVEFRLSPRAPVDDDVFPRGDLSGPPLLGGGFVSLPSAGLPQRTVTLVEIMGDDGPLMALLNNRKWDNDAVTENPKVNTLEQWNIVNTTADTHPIHLHLVQFQLLERQAFDVDDYMERVYGTTTLEHDDAGAGAQDSVDVQPGELVGPPTAPAATERGWKDTIQAHPGTVTRILVPFGPDAAPGVPFGQNTLVPYSGQYVWHCHILDHEDNEMMLPYRVEP